MFCIFLSVIALVITEIAAELAVINRNSTQAPFSKVTVDVYYESLCPDSIRLYEHELKPLYRTLGMFLNINTYPYGKATTSELNGRLHFQCQHGEPECYGNKLQACSIQLLRDINKYIYFNACLMNRGSDDIAADQCGIMHNVNAAVIKNCAKTHYGNQLLKQYGDLSRRVKYDYIPHVVINGRPLRPRENLMRAVCAAFLLPPPGIAC